MDLRIPVLLLMSLATASAGSVNKDSRINSKDGTSYNLQPNRQSLSTAMFCRDTTATGSNGHIYSHEYPQNYTANENCNIVIQTGFSQIDFFVADFQTEPDRDILTITDNNGVYNYSGNDLQMNTHYYFDSKNGEILMQFVSDAFNNDRGFSLEYTLIPYPTTVTTTPAPTAAPTPAPTPAPPGGTYSPGVLYACPDVTGVWESIAPNANAEIQLNQDADLRITGLFRDTLNPVYLGMEGYNGRDDGGSKTVILTFYGDEEAMSLTGFCKLCDGQAQLDLYKTSIQQTNIDCTASQNPDLEPLMFSFQPR